MDARVGEMPEPCSSNRPTKLPQADWTVYYDVQNKAKRCSTKDDFLKLITTAGTCQDRGSLDKIMSANRIEPKDATKVNFRCFRCDVQPIWEVFAILSVPDACFLLARKARVGSVDFCPVAPCWMQRLRRILRMPGAGRQCGASARNTRGRS